MTKEWIIKYWPSQGKSDIERWYAKLDNEQQQTVFELVAKLKEAGNELQLPHSRPLGKKLFELRDKQYGFRIYYTFYKGRIIVLLTAGDKSSQERDIKLARMRLTLITKQGEEIL